MQLVEGMPLGYNLDTEDQNRTRGWDEEGFRDYRIEVLLNMSISCCLHRYCPLSTGQCQGKNRIQGSMGRRETGQEQCTSAGIGSIAHSNVMRKQLQLLTFAFHISSMYSE